MCLQVIVLTVLCACRPSSPDPAQPLVFLSASHLRGPLVWGCQC